MQSTKCLFSASAALHRVFIYPLEMPHFRQPIRRNIHTLKTRPQIPICLAIQSRSYAFARPTTGKSILPRNHEIKNMMVNVIDQQGVFHPEQRTRYVLQDLNLRTHQLVCVTKPPDDWKMPAICKVMTTRQVEEMDEREKQLAKEARKKDPVSIVKNIELNWAIDGNDLGHRMKKMREFLGRGNRIEVTISPKRKGRKAAVDEAETLLGKLREVIVDEEGQRLGWKEWKDMDGDVAGVATLYFEGKMDPEEVEREREKEQAEMEKEESEEADEAERKKQKEISQKQLDKREKWRKKEKGLLNPGFVVKKRLY